MAFLLNNLTIELKYIEQKAARDVTIEQDEKLMILK